MTEDKRNSNLVRKTICIHKTLISLIEQHQKDELLTSFTDAAMDLIKKGLEKVKEEKKKW